MKNMMEYSFQEVKYKLETIVAKGFEPELRLFLYDKEYMIIAYKDHCSFQRCGYKSGSGEVDYRTLDELYYTKTVDNILLEKDWNNIKAWECFEIEALELKGEAAPLRQKD